MKNIKYKLGRLRRKSYSEIGTTIVKRLPAVVRNKYYEYLLKSEPRHFLKNIKKKRFQDRELNQNFFWFNESNLDKFLICCDVESKNLLEAADSIIENKFLFLGKKPRLNSSGKILWSHSIEKEVSWPHIFHSKINYHDFLSYGDPKYVWELNRHQHLIILAEAFIISKNKKYLNEIIDHIHSWINQNNYLFGINWVEGMEVSLRAISWIWVYSYIGDTEQFGKVKDIFLQYLYLHGRYIENNLSDKWIKNNNHIIAELVGLIYLGNFFREFSFGTKWLENSARKLESELDYQVLPDGLIFEPSSSYHIFVTELVYHASAILAINNAPSSSINLVLTKILKSAGFFLTSNDDFVKIGDCDDGLVFPRRLLISNHLILNKPNLSSKIYNQLFINSLLVKNNIETPSRTLKYFEDSGILVHKNRVKGKDISFFFTFGNSNTSFRNGHKHSDYLAINLFYGSKKIITNGGTFKYFDTLSKRLLFRDERTQSNIQFNGERYVSYDQRFEVDSNTLPDCKLISLEGDHDGFKALAQIKFKIGIFKVKVMRQILFDKFVYYITDEVFNFTGNFYSKFISPSISVSARNSFVLNEDVNIKSNNNCIGPRAQICSYEYGKLTEYDALYLSSKKGIVKTEISFK